VKQFDPLCGAGLLILEACIQEGLKTDLVFTLNRTSRLQAWIVLGGACLGVPPFDLRASVQVWLSFFKAQEIDQDVLRQVTFFSEPHQPVGTSDTLADVLLNGEGTWRCGSIDKQSPRRQVEPVLLTLALIQAELASDLSKGVCPGFDVNLAVRIDKVVHDGIHRRLLARR
jgi:hypothetical protein